MRDKGILIAIEGISGSGKTTLSNLLKNKLVDIGYLVECLGGFNLHAYHTELTKFCRDLVNRNRFFRLPLSAEFHLLLAELCMEIEKNVKPLLGEGYIVLFDSYIKSILAYESGVVSSQKINQSNDLVLRFIEESIKNTAEIFEFPQEDLTLYLNCDVSETIPKLIKRDRLEFTQEDKLLQLSIADHYRKHLIRENTIFIQSGDESDLNDVVESIKKLAAVRFIGN